MLNYLLFPKQRIDWGQRAAWGVAFSVFVGGILNITWMISRTSILIYLGLGFVYWLIDVYQNKESLINSLIRYVHNCQKDRIIFIGTVACLSLTFLRYSGSISTHLFNGLDDYHAYFAYIKQMIETGPIGSDPFNDRRIFTLGGKPFLDTFVLSVL